MPQLPQACAFWHRRGKWLFRPQFELEVVGIILFMQHTTFIHASGVSLPSNLKMRAIVSLIS